MAGRRDVCGNRFGTSFEARRWLSLDVCGTFGVMFSFVIHLFAFVVIVMHLISGSLTATAVFLLLYTPSVFMAVWSLLKAYLTDPGAVPLGARPLVTVRRAQSSTASSDDGNSVSSQSNKPQPRQRAIRRCHKCNDNYKPNRAHHDSVTGRCIVKFDHFCPWVGNAIGALNHKFFVLFVGYTMSSCFFSLLLIAMRAVHCGLPPTAPQSRSPSTSSTGTDTNNSLTHERLEECRGWDESYFGLILLIVSVVFGIFTSCMLCEQIDAIKTNRSKIARMKMRVGETGTELCRVTEEFNEMFGGTSNNVAWHWFVPLPVEFPRGMEKVVLGYEWDISFEPVPYQEPTHSHSNGSNTASVTADLELGIIAGGAGGSVGGTTTLSHGSSLGGPGPLPSPASTSRPPSRTPSSSSKDKNSDHDVFDDEPVTPQTTCDDVALDGTPVPSASSPAPTKSRSYKIISRHNSRGTIT